VQRLLKAGVHRGMAVQTKYALVLIETRNGWRVILPPEL
jgi:hypothetical protein